MLKHSEENLDYRKLVESTWGRYSEQIYKICEQKCDTKDEARDLFQTVALRFCENMEHLLNRENMFPWLLAVLRHTYLDFVAEGKRALPMSGVKEPAVEYGAFREDEAMYYEVQPEMDVVGLLEMSMRILTPLERMLIEMKYYGGFSVREISNILGLSENAVRKRRYNAFQKMRRRLGEDSSEAKIAQ